MLFGSGKKWLNLPKWLNFIFVFSFSFWDKMKLFLFIKVIEMTMKWISKRMMKLYEFHNQSQTEKNVISINLSFDLIVYSTLVHSSLNPNKCVDDKGREKKNNNQTQISYLFEGSYKYLWSHNSFLFHFRSWIWI